MSERRMLEGQTFLILKKNERGYMNDQVRCVRATKNKPALDKNEICVRVNLSVPSTAFEEFIPAYTMKVGENHVGGPIELEPLEPLEPEGVE